LATIRCRRKWIGRRCLPTNLSKIEGHPALLPERLIRERAAKEKRTFFRDAHSDRFDTFDGGDFAVGQVFCAEATGEFAASE
jgi:hypothetical protein